MGQSDTKINTQWPYFTPGRWPQFTLGLTYRAVRRISGRIDRKMAANAPGMDRYGYGTTVKNVLARNE
jgi:hypothetical protein